MRFQLTLPGAAAAALGLVCLGLVVVGGAYPFTSRQNWQWSWESPSLALVGLLLAAGAVVGASLTGWRALHDGAWSHVALAALFLGSAAVAILLLWRSGSWLPSVAAELLEQ